MSCWIHKKHDGSEVSGRLVNLSADRTDIALPVNERARRV